MVTDIKFRKTYLLLFIVTINLCWLSCRNNNESNTKIVWEIKTKGQTARVHFTYKNHLYVTAGKYIDYGSPNRFIYCINLKNGKIKWVFDIGNELLLQHFTLINNKIFWISNENRLIICLDAISGKKINNTLEISLIHNKKIPLNHLYYNNKCLVDRGNYKKRKPRRIYCIDKKTNKEIWSFKVRRISLIYEPDEIDFTFLIFKDKLLIGNHDGKITCVKIF